MKEVKILFKPEEIYILRILFTITGAFALLLPAYVMSFKLWGYYAAVFLAVFVFLIFYGGFKKTTVRYDDSRICWKWFWKNYNIDMNRVKSFSHVMKRYQKKNHTEYWAELRFNMSYGEGALKYICLRAEPESISGGINDRNIEDTVIIEIYEHFARLYPEKAKGEIKYDKHCM
ncbi:MAG: hypothetical protein GXY08_10180 [Ruminococcus sp.]|nr:hypothetical protein [Ruminococcus sp.]